MRVAHEYLPGKVRGCAMHTEAYHSSAKHLNRLLVKLGQSNLCSICQHIKDGSAETTLAIYKDST